MSINPISSNSALIYYLREHLNEIKSKSAPPQDSPWFVKAIPTSPYLLKAGQKIGKALDLGTTLNRDDIRTGIQDYSNKYAKGQFKVTDTQIDEFINQNYRNSWDLEDALFKDPKGNFLTAADLTRKYRQLIKEEDPQLAQGLKDKEEEAVRLKVMPGYLLGYMMHYTPFGAVPYLNDLWQLQKDDKNKK